MDLQKIKNIIFDLGGVIIDIDPSQSFQALQELTKHQPEEAHLLSENAALFLEYEKGLMDNATFRQRIRALSGDQQLADHLIDEAWNAMLLSIPVERIELLQKLRDKYSLYVLSNTNDIHVVAFNKIVREVSGASGLDVYFDKVYYSHQLQMRKPDGEIYQHVLQENGLVPEETLFIDDRYENIQAAASLGIQTFHVQKEQDIVGFFNHL